MGQENRYQSQAAAQAPTISQISYMVRAWVVEVEGRTHRPGLQGPKGVSMLSYLKLSFQISRLFKVLFYSFSYGQEYCLILVHLIHSLLHHV